MYMYICMCLYVCTCLCVLVCVYVCVCVYTFVYVYIYVCLCVCCTCLCICMLVCVCTCTTVLIRRSVTLPAGAGSFHLPCEFWDLSLGSRHIHPLIHLTSPRRLHLRTTCVHPERQTKHRLFSKFSKLATELSYEKQQPWLKETARVPFICVEKADRSFWCLRQLCREFVCPYLSKYLLTLCTAVQTHVQVAQLSLLFFKDVFLLFYLYKCLPAFVCVHLVYAWDLWEQRQRRNLLGCERWELNQGAWQEQQAL